MRSLGLLFVTGWVVSIGNAQENVLPPPKPLPSRALPRTAKPVEPKVDPEELKKAISELQKQRDAFEATQSQANKSFDASQRRDQAEVIKLRMRVRELLLRLQSRKQPITAVPTQPFESSDRRPPIPNVPAPPITTQNPPALPSSPQPPKRTVPPLETPKEEILEGAPVAPLDRAQTLFRLGHYQKALAAFQRLDLTQLPREEQLNIQYFVANCLQKVGRISDATTAYQGIVSTDGTYPIKNIARWQLSNINFRSDLENDIKQLRQQTRSVGGPPR